MSHDPHPVDAIPTLAGAPPLADRTLASTIQVPLVPDIKIRNLRGGQMVVMDVRGAWSEEELEERLLRFISVRQPAALAIEVADPSHDLQLARARTAIESFGGSLTVTVAPAHAVADDA